MSEGPTTQPASAPRLTVELEYGPIHALEIVPHAGMDQLHEIELSAEFLAQKGISVPPKATVALRRYVIVSDTEHKLVYYLLPKSSGGFLGLFRSRFNDLSVFIQVCITFFAALTLIVYGFIVTRFLSAGGPDALVGWLVEHLWVGLAVSVLVMLWMSLRHAILGNNFVSMLWFGAIILLTPLAIWWWIELRPTGDITGAEAYRAFGAGLRDQYAWVYGLLIPWLPVISLFAGVIGVSVIGKIADGVKPKS